MVQQNRIHDCFNQFIYDGDISLSEEASRIEFKILLFDLLECV